MTDKPGPSAPPGREQMVVILTRRSRWAGLAMAVLVVAGATLTAHADSSGAVPVKRACPDSPSPGTVTCLALVRTDVVAQRGTQPQSAPAGLGATAIRDAYRLPTATGGKGQIAAVINVFDDPKAEADLAVYRAQYGLPPCTTANGCFRKVNADGGTRPPRADTGWAEEISLDLDMLSAACPNCRILLVEADQPSIAALGRGVDTAVRLGAKYISNSYGGAEAATAAPADYRHFDHL